MAEYQEFLWLEGLREVDNLISKHGTLEEDLYSVPKEYWKYLHKDIRIHWFDSDLKIMIPRKILAICDDCIVLGSLSNYGSQHLTHPSEVLVDIEQLYQLFDRTGECSELIDAITK